MGDLVQKRIRELETINDVVKTFQKDAKVCVVFVFSIFFIHKKTTERDENTVKHAQLVNCIKRSLCIRRPIPDIASQVECFDVVDGGVVNKSYYTNVIDLCGDLRSS